MWFWEEYLTSKKSILGNNFSFHPSMFQFVVAIKYSLSLQSFYPFGIKDTLYVLCEMCIEHELQYTPELF